MTEPVLAHIHVPVNIPLPQRLCLKGNIATNWKCFEREWLNYEIAARLKDPEKPDENKPLRTATLLACIGSDALDVYDTLDFENDAERKDIDIVLGKLRKYCIGETNETYERFVFNKRDQLQDETVDEYVMCLKKLAKTCNFGALEESLTRDRIVVGIRDEATQKRLLQQQGLTLKTCVDTCRAFESTAHKMKAMKGNESVEAVGKLKQWRQQKGSGFRTSEPQIQCKYCGKKHVRDKLKCPAWGKTCSACSLSNHFAAVCKSAQYKKKPIKMVDTDSEDEDDEYVGSIDAREISAIEGCETNTKLYATMMLNGREEKFQLDSGATVNILPERAYKKLYGQDSIKQLDNTNVILVMYNNAKEKPLGKKRVRVVNPKNNKRYSVEFVVVRGKYKSLLGVKACQQMQLISVNKENIQMVEALETKKLEVESAETKKPEMKKTTEPEMKTTEAEKSRKPAMRSANCLAGLTKAQISEQYRDVFKGTLQPKYKCSSYERSY